MEGSERWGTRLISKQKNRTEKEEQEREKRDGTGGGKDDIVSKASGTY